MIARHLEDATLVVVASPAYLNRAGAPRTLTDLEQHECIQFDLPSSGRRIPWLFNEDCSEKEIFLAGNYSCTGDVLAGVTLAKADAGLFQTYKFIVKKELADGSLVEVLQPFGGCSRPLGLLYPYGRLLPSRVRAIVDFMVEQTELLKASEAKARPSKAKRSK